MRHAAFCFFHTDVRLRRRHKRIPAAPSWRQKLHPARAHQLAARITTNPWT